MPIRLKASELAAWRKAKLKEQGGVCLLTGYPLSEADAVADHCHTTGRLRGVIHRGANALLGKLENNYRRYGLSLPQTYAMCRNTEVYLSRDFSQQPYYPTHRTEDEKRLLKNKRARTARAKAKAAQ